MSRIEIHPAYRALFAEQGLRAAEDFLRLDGEILGGHPDRHVLWLTLGGGQARDNVAVAAAEVSAAYSVLSTETATAAHAGDVPSASTECSVPNTEAAAITRAGDVPSASTECSVPSTEAAAAMPVAVGGSMPTQRSVLGTEPAPGAQPVDTTRGPLPLRVYLKKEHRLSWRDRLAHAWLGFGWVSKSTREGRMLRQVERAGVGCPRALAWGEADGRAFLLVREEPGVADLREYLRAHPDERKDIAEALAQAIAKMHAAGFFHRDLSSKHILIGREESAYRFCFLDWQRARRMDRVNWRERLMDLAMLDATLATDCASPRERLLFWNAYVAAVDPFRTAARSRNRQNSGSSARIPANSAARTEFDARPQRLLHVLCRLSARLQHKRRIRELRQTPLPAGKQNLIWLDGEALCVTREFLDEVGSPPSWLQASFTGPPRNALEVSTVAGTDGRSWRLVRRWSYGPLRWLLRRWRRPAFPAPEFEHAAAIIRLERYGVEAPRLLALGHRSLRPWRKASFLLVEPPSDTAPLLTMLETASLKQRRRLLRQAGALWRRLHEAGYAWRGQSLAPLAVSLASGDVVLTGVEWLQRASATPERLAWRDLFRLQGTPPTHVSATDRLRFGLGYFGQEHATGAAATMLRRLIKATKRSRRRRAWRAWRERRVS